MGLIRRKLLALKSGDCDRPHSHRVSSVQRSSASVQRCQVSNFYGKFRLVSVIRINFQRLFALQNKTILMDANCPEKNILESFIPGLFD